MNEVSVKTAGLREQASELNREAHRYNRRFQEMEEVISWLKWQEFDGADELYHTLRKQNEEMTRQRRNLLLLTEALKRICDKYDRTEQEIMEQGERRTQWGEVQSLDIAELANNLLKMGLQVSGQE